MNNMPTEVHLTHQKSLMHTQDLHQLLEDLSARYSKISPRMDDSFLHYLVNETSSIPREKERLERIALEIAGKGALHSDYSLLAGRLIAYTRETYSGIRGKTFTERMEAIHQIHERDPSFKRKLSPDFLSFIRKNANAIDEAVDRTREYRYDYFAAKTAANVYLGNHNGEDTESIQDMHMRVAVAAAIASTGRRREDPLAHCLDIYRDASLHRYIHATPVNTNSGYDKAQLSSCFLSDVPDSIEGIYEAQGDCALIHSKMGGCAISVQGIRSQGAIVGSTGGKSAGMMQFLQGFDHTSKIVTAGGRRSGSNAAWCEPHHPDILDFLSCRTIHGSEKMKMRTIFLGVAVNDLFMQKVESDGDWYLLDPSVYPGLKLSHNRGYQDLYEKYSQQAEELLQKIGKTAMHGDQMYTHVVGNCARIKAVYVWNAIKRSISDSGIPYIINKDAVNRKSNHSNRGCIFMSNLCCEIAEFCDEEETAVCTLGNLILPTFVVKNGTYVDFDWKGLHSATKRLCRNLNSILDSQALPSKKARRSNDTMRSIGIGIQGLADVFISYGIPYSSRLAKELNRRIMETIHHAALEASCELAAETRPYPHWKTNGGSYLANGKFHHEIMNYNGELMWDWERLREDIGKHGVANSLTVAIAPTSTTSIVCGNQESFQPILSNMIARRTLSGEFMVTEPSLIRELEKIGMWNEDTRQQIEMDRGSIKNLNVSDELKAIYRTAFEMSMKDIIDMAADREYFVDQSQSLNLFNTRPDQVSEMLDSTLMYAWKKGLNTLQYYFRSQAATKPLAMTFKTSEVRVSDPSSTGQRTTTPELVKVVETCKEEVEVEARVCRREAGCVWCE